MVDRIVTFLGCPCNFITRDPAATKPAIFDGKSQPGRCATDGGLLIIWWFLKPCGTPQNPKVEGLLLLDYKWLLGVRGTPILRNHWLSYDCLQGPKMSEDRQRAGNSIGSLGIPVGFTTRMIHHSGVAPEHSDPS